MLTWAAFGAAPSGARRERLEASPNWRGGRFVNALPPRHDMASALVKWIRGAPDREPRVEIPVIPRRADEFAKPPPGGLRATWLGHSSTLIEIGGRRFLTDPVFSRRISPSPFVGPRRFFASPIAAADLPDLDAIVLSHDHFDHLDLETVRALRPTTFVVPLGVGAHLASWGIPEERIVELDWWQSTDVGGVELVCTPARHFSGRSPTTRDATLWCGWAFVAARHRVFFSGDTALFPGFSEIGQRLGPFDLTLMESGAYDAAWADVHIGPEQAVRAHEMLRGRVMLPVHWGTFNLALHPWTEPAERALVAARARGVTLVVPRPGESIDPLSPPQAVRWWPELPWTRAEQAPVISSGMLAEAG